MINQVPTEPIVSGFAASSDMFTRGSEMEYTTIELQVSS